MDTATISAGYRAIRSVHLASNFVDSNKLTAGQRYTIRIEPPEKAGNDAEPLTTEGTLQPCGTIGGLAILYRKCQFQEDDEVQVAYDGTTLILYPTSDQWLSAEATDAPRETAEGQGEGQPRRPVLQASSTRYIHLEAYAPGNVSRWEPQSEADVYMVFGAVSELTDYRYCCGLNKRILEALKWHPTGALAATPDAILIDRTTGEYLVAEFKIESKAFTTNHNADDIDVLVCWTDNAQANQKLPDRRVELRRVVEDAVRVGQLNL